MEKVLLINYRVNAINPTNDDIKRYPNQLVKVIEVSIEQAASTHVGQFYDTITQLFYDVDVYLYRNQQIALMDLIKNKLLNATVIYNNHVWSISDESQTKIMNAIQMYNNLGTLSHCTIIDNNNKLVELTIDEIKELLSIIYNKQINSNKQIHELYDNQPIFNTNHEWSVEFNRLLELLNTIY